jgi:Zn-dependent peptidase ImmA (M78 family)
MVRNRKRSILWTSAAARRLRERAGGCTDIDQAVYTVAKELLDGIECPPTDLTSLSAKVGVTRLEALDIAGSGELRRDAEGSAIVYSRYLTQPRRRFTIAHEVGHVIIESTGQHAPRNGREVERLCDMLAAEMLMPRDVFAKRLPPNLSMEDVFAISREFQTSLSTTAIRCAELAGVSVFGVESGKITWAHGRMKKGRLDLLDDSLKSLIHAACAGTSGEEQLYLNHDGDVRAWKVQYQALKRGNQALFLLQPLRSGTHPSIR